MMHLRREIDWVIAVTGALALGGCATLTSGTTQRVHFESTPPGAKATLSHGAELQTPGYLELPRSRTYDVVIEKPGYLPAHTHIGQGTNPAMFGNLLLGGLIGLLIDSSTGAAYVLEPERVSVVLLADPATTPEPTTNEPAAAEIPATP